MSAARSGVARRLGHCCLLSLCLAGALAGTAVAQTAVAPEDVAAIARSLNCPLCQGYNLQDCPLEVCTQMRDLIRERLAAGDSRETIVARFVADYGPEVLNAPPPTGFFLTAWLVPVFVVLLGGVAAAWSIRRSTAAARSEREQGEVGAAVACSAEATAYRDRLEGLVERDP